MFAASAAFAAATAAATSLAPHRTWATFAACAYTTAAVLAAKGGKHLAWRTALTGAVAVPLVLLLLRGTAQEELHVVHRAAARLLTEGTPYLSAARLEGADYSAYNPYLPGMALFGVPHQLAGVDARLVFAAFFAVALALSVRLVHGAGQGRRTAAVFVASPLVALPMVTGGDDLPVIGLVCLGLALAGRGRPGWSGLALGVAGILKATAWPALAVTLALLAVRGGHRGALRYAASAALPLAWGLGLPALADPGGLVANTIRYPLGLSGAESPAAAPLPGRLLADTGPFGHALAVGGLAVAALAVAASLCVRPPGDVRAAAVRLALGLLVAMALMPASRFGYLVYPTVLVLWAYWRNPDAERHAGPQPEEPEREEPERGPESEPHAAHAGLGGWPHADRHERLPAQAGRDREVRARDGAALPAG